MLKILLIVIAIIIILIIAFNIHNYKKLNIATTTMFTGSPKTGKTWIAVWCAIKEHKKAIRRYKIKRIFYKVFKKKKALEKPVLYSNIPLNYPHTKLTIDMILRNERFAYKSIILISEASLVADSMQFKDKSIMDNLTYLLKLIGHETRGGKIIYESQCLSDLAYPFKRVSNTYYWLYKTINIPLVPFGIFKIKEQAYSDDGGTINLSDGDDIEKSFKWLIVPKKIWKMYDCYTYSILTDNLKYKDDSVKLKGNELKTNNILQINQDKRKILFKNIGGEINEANK